MLSAIVMVQIEENPYEIIEQVISLAEDIIILTVWETGYTVSQHGTGRVYVSSPVLKGYGELIRECMEYAEGEYAVFLKCGECISLKDGALDLKEGFHAYYADILEDRYEGRVMYREARVFQKGICLQGKYRLEEIAGLYSCGLCVHSFPLSEKSFTKEWMKRENQYSDDASLEWKDEYILAECCYLLGQYTDACGHYKRIWKSEELQLSVSMYRDICWAFIAGDCLADGKAAVEEATTVYPDCRELYYIGAIIYKELDDNVRCISCLKRMWEANSQEDKELTEYLGIRSYKLIAEAFYNIENYDKAADYYRLCILKEPEDCEYMMRLCSSLHLSGCCKEEIEAYLTEQLHLSKGEVDEVMVCFYKSLRMWDKVEKYRNILQGIKGKRAAVDSLFHMKVYRRCLSEITNSTLMYDEYYSVMGLCCIMLDSDMPGDSTRDFIVKLKSQGRMELLHMYEFFVGKRKHTCSEGLLERFSELLLETGDSRCIKLVRRALDENISIDHMKLINTAFRSRLYYFCEEIISIYYAEGRYEYEVLRVLAYVYYHTGNNNECEKYISYALTIKKSTDLIKLGCMCKLRECEELINSCENSKDLSSVQRLLNTISEYEKILV